MKRSLAQKVSTGEKARQVIGDVGPYLQQIENQFLAELLQAARENKPTELQVMKLLAVSELGISLQTAVDTGRSAAQKLHEQSLQAAQQVKEWTDQNG